LSLHTPLTFRVLVNEGCPLLARSRGLNRRVERRLMASFQGSGSWKIKRLKDHLLHIDFFRDQAVGKKQVGGALLVGNVDGL